MIIASSDFEPQDIDALYTPPTYVTTRRYDDSKLNTLILQIALS